MRSSKFRKGVLAFKVDFEKAYNRVNWNFLEIILVEFQFPPLIIRLIICCVNSVGKAGRPPRQKRGRARQAELGRRAQNSSPSCLRAGW